MQQAFRGSEESWKANIVWLVSSFNSLENYYCSQRGEKYPKYRLNIKTSETTEKVPANRWTPIVSLASAEQIKDRRYFSAATKCGQAKQWHTGLLHLEVPLVVRVC